MLKELMSTSLLLFLLSTSCVSFTFPIDRFAYSENATWTTPPQISSIRIELTDWICEFQCYAIQSTKRTLHSQYKKQKEYIRYRWILIYWEQIRLKSRIGYDKLKVIPLNFQCHLFDVNLLHYWNSHLSFHLVFTCSICDSVVVCRSITDSK